MPFIWTLYKSIIYTNNYYFEINIIFEFGYNEQKHISSFFNSIVYI